MSVLLTGFEGDRLEKVFLGAGLVLSNQYAQKIVVFYRNWQYARSTSERAVVKQRSKRRKRHGAYRR